MKLYILLAFLITFIFCTECPNGCSGHGTCSSNSECICNRQVGVGLNQGDFEEFSYTGADCSERLCPKGGSYAATPSKSWWEISSATYPAYFVTRKCFRTEVNDIVPDSSKYIGKTFIVIKGDVPELTTYASGGIVNCYEDYSSKSFVGSYRIYNATPDNNNEYTVLIGETIYGKAGNIYWIYNSSVEEPNPKCTPNDPPIKDYYCKVVRSYQDISLLAALPINTESTKEDVDPWTFTQEDGKKTDGSTDDTTGDVINFAHLYYAYMGVFNGTVNVVCPKNKESEMEVFQTKMIITVVGSKYTVTINKVPSTYGNCFLLYSPINGNLDLLTSEIRYLIGTSGIFGDKVEDSSFIWKTVDKESIFDLSRSLYTIPPKDTTKLDKRKSSIGEVMNSISDGSSAIMYTIDLYPNTTSKDEDIFFPIRNQIVHIKSPDVNDNKLTLNVLENINPDYMCEGIAKQGESTTEPTTSTPTEATTTTPPAEVDHCANAVIGLQLFQEGPHGAVECSGVGECNRETGKCECPIGYQGSACQRTSCPNNCSGKGKCLPYSSSESIYGDEVLYRCVCDGGFRGSDCSKFECPSKSDPKGATNTGNGDEFRDCSGRGICDYDTGLCSCFDGFSGEACDKISSMY